MAQTETCEGFTIPTEYRKSTDPIVLLVVLAAPPKRPNRDPSAVPGAAPGNRLDIPGLRLA